MNIQNLVLENVFDVLVYEDVDNHGDGFAVKPVLLFEIKSALENKLEVNVNTGMGIFKSEHCFFYPDILDQIARGGYKHRNLRLVLKTKARDSETLEDVMVKINVPFAFLREVKYGSQPNRFMSNTAVFEIFKKTAKEPLFTIELDEVSKDE